MQAPRYAHSSERHDQEDEERKENLDEVVIAKQQGFVSISLLIFIFLHHDELQLTQYLECYVSGTCDQDSHQERVAAQII